MTTGLYAGMFGSLALSADDRFPRAQVRSSRRHGSQVELRDSRESSSESGGLSLKAQQYGYSATGRPPWIGRTLGALLASAMMTVPGVVGVAAAADAASSATSSCRVTTATSLEAAGSRQSRAPVRRVSLAEAREIAARVLRENEARRVLLAQAEGRRAEAMLGDLYDL